MSLTKQHFLGQIRARVMRTLKDGIQVDMSNEECKKYLKRHVHSKTNLVIMFVDINNSTQMSLTLSEKKFALILQTFAQEVGITVLGYGGYVFKYEGDAIIALFPAEYDRTKACKNALNCSRTILEVINEVINPVFKEYNLSEITIRIGLAYGYALVVLYGKSLEEAHIDIVGSSISLASKIASIAQPNQILVGEYIYNILRSSAKNEDFLANVNFKELNLSPTSWKYLSRSDPESLYRVYELLEL
jgi:adenylate cyclase